MSYRIEEIRFYVRETRPGRLAVALGKRIAGAEPAKPTTNPLAHVRMVLRDADGNESFGCSGDRLSVRWLDKRPGRSHARKLHDLVDLIEMAGRTYLAEPSFETPFDKWLASHHRIMEAGRSRGQEDLSSTFASALLERAMLDACCRLEKRSLFDMTADDRLGFIPAKVHPELKGAPWKERLPRRPRTRFRIRHTVGPYDPLVAADLRDGRRADDGLPETLEDYVRDDGVTYFKVKVSGNADYDLKRLARIWDVVPHQPETALTLDANEAFDDAERFAGFVGRLEKEQPGLFQHLLFIEQPLTRRLALDPKVERWVRKAGRSKPVTIDESDDHLDAFKRAHALGYAGTSHKNCKGFFKSLLNHALTTRFNQAGGDTFLTAEDLQNLPIVPLQQDFVSLSVLGIEHCERNGHHFNYGLSMLSPADRASALKHHPDLYERRGGEWFLNVRDGHVDCGSLQVPSYGVVDEPDWASMRNLREWLDERHPV